MYKAALLSLLVIPVAYYFTSIFLTSGSIELKTSTQVNITITNMALSSVSRGIAKKVLAVETPEGGRKALIFSLQMF